ncbi:MAG TPA: amidohydrolase family protein, partial [Acidimicrobiales bacterium]|nr:amidohydrolase family protein [Acidimicrobiales bacterium]
WPAPADAEYQATVMAPSLMAERLEELGIDFAIVYPSLGLALCTLPDSDLRQGVCMALNRMNAELCGPHAERLTPSSVIPMHTPTEAIETLGHATEVGLRVAMIPPAVARPVTAYPDAFPTFSRLDRYGIDSDHDYDAVWQAFVDHRVAVSAHGGLGFRYLPSSSRSTSNYVFNHVLGHAEFQEHLCRSLVFGGVPQRFPQLPFLFMEGGVLWALALLAALEEHWEKRSARGLSAFDPARLDLDRLGELLTAHGLPPQAPQMLEREGPQPWVRDEFADSGISEEEDLARIFGEQFFFGCESDDIGVHRALDARGNPLGAALRPLFSSDIGHWDVPRLIDVVPQSRHLVDAGLLDAAGYQRFVFDDVVRAHTRLNPGFFKGTTVEKEVSEIAP